MVVAGSLATVTVTLRPVSRGERPLSDGAEPNANSSARLGQPHADEVTNRTLDPAHSDAPTLYAQSFEAGIETGYLGFVGYRPPSYSQWALTSDDSPSVGLSIAFQRRIVSSIFLELAVRGGLRTSLGAGWYAMGAIGLALQPTGWIGASARMVVGGAGYDYSTDLYSISAIRNDIRVYPVHRGTSVGGEIALKLALATWSHAALILTLSCAALKDATEPGVVILAPVSFGIRWR